MKKLPALLFLLALTIYAPAEMSVFREPGAAYLADLFTKPLKLKVLKTAPIYYDAPMTRSLGVLQPGQLVEVQAVLEDNLRVVGKARQGQVAGWLPASYLEPLDPDFLVKVKQAAVRKTQIDALIEKNEVAMGMTADEVTRSLGKPPKTRQRQDASGSSEVWEYIRYERVPQQTTGYDSAGRYVTATIYVKVPNGKLIVSFENGLVSAVEQSEGTLQPGNKITIVAPPIIIR
ncbi:MAG: hypothetical protein ABIT76_10175 [Chthoniobacterales bacterium]